MSSMYSQITFLLYLFAVYFVYRLYIPSSSLSWLDGCLVGMLLISRSGFVEKDAVKVFHYYGFHLSSSLLMYNLKSFQGK